MNIEIPALSDWQQSAIDKQTRRNLVNAGRQSGKSTLIIELVYEAVVKQQRIALLFPVYRSLWTHWGRIINIFFAAIADKNESRMLIEFSGGATLECFSGESADNMRGNQFDVVIVDEAAHILKLQEIVEGVILPTLLFRHGSLWLLSTPKGTAGYFNTCKLSGLWTVTTATSYQNPYIDRKEIDQLKQSMSPEKIQQELLGIPVDETAVTPFFYGYTDQHFNLSVIRQPRLPLWLSFDFNVGVMSVVVAQVGGDYRTEVLALIQLNNSSVEQICDRLLQLYPVEIKTGNFRITGDATGAARSGLFIGNISYYQIIKQKLGARDYNLKVPTHNFGHGQSQQLVNAVIHSGLVTVASPELNRQIKALCIDDGGIIKDGNDHGTDCFRYLIHSLYLDFLTRPHKYLQTKSTLGIS